MLELFSWLPMKTIPPAQPVPQPQPKAEVEKRHNGRQRKNRNEFISYYNHPIIKKAHWNWPIWLYFWLGGIAGGASAIATLAEMMGKPEQNRSIVRLGRYISLVGLMISPVLLIIDLQRPERFHHMLRVLKLRSPLSLGTYILTTTGIMSGINAAGQIVEDGLVSPESLPGKFVRLSSNGLTSSLQGVGGLGVGSYTGVLLSATATPLWAESYKTLGPIFISTAMSNGAAAISLVGTMTGMEDENLATLENIEQFANVSEMTLTAVTALSLKPEVQRAFISSIYGKICLLGVLVGQVLPFLLQRSGKDKPNRGRSFLTSLMVLIGGFLLRFGIIEGGKATSQNPAAYRAITEGRARPMPEAYQE
jgi:formate-dependent nitrite reductase membrane component NrfD